MADAETIQATPENLPQKLAEVLSRRLERQNEQEINEERLRQDRLVKAQAVRKIDDRFPPQVEQAVRPLKSAAVNEQTINPTFSPTERLQREQEQEARMLRNRQELKQQMKAYREVPLTLPVEIQSTPEGQGVLEKIARYQEQYTKAPAGGPVRAKIMKDINEYVGEVSRAKIKQIAGEKLGGKIITLIWRTASDGSTVEWEGLTGWFITIVGACLWAIRALVTIFNLQNPRWLKYAAFDLKDPVTWTVDLPYGIMALLIITAIFIIINALLLIIGSILAGAGVLAEYFGFINFF